MSKMEGMDAFKPHKDNVRAKDEEKHRQTLDTHNRGMFDEAPDERINEATGKMLGTSSEIGGADEKRTVIHINEKDESEDALGKVPGALPDDAAKLKAWMAKEQARLEKKKNNLKKAA
jgi:hypothetical protein